MLVSFACGTSTVACVPDQNSPIRTSFINLNFTALHFSVSTWAVDRSWALLFSDTEYRNHTMISFQTLATGAYVMTSPWILKLADMDAAAMILPTASWNTVCTLVQLDPSKLSQQRLVADTRCRHKLNKLQLRVSNSTEPHKMSGGSQPHSLGPYQVYIQHSLGLEPSGARPCWQQCNGKIKVHNVIF